MLIIHFQDYQDDDDDLYQNLTVSFRSHGYGFIYIINMMIIMLQLDLV